MKASENIAHDHEQKREIEFLKCKLGKATNENTKQEKVVKDMTREIKNKELHIKESSEKIKVLSEEKQADKRHIENLRKRVNDLELCKSNILNQNASSIEVIDALQTRLDSFENRKGNTFGQKSESYAEKACGKDTTETSDPIIIKPTVSKTKTPEGQKKSVNEDMIIKMIKSLETRLLNVENRNERSENVSGYNDHQLKQENTSLSGKEGHVRRKPCFYFRRNGYCRYGENCKYEHEYQRNFQEESELRYEESSSHKGARTLLIGSSILKGVNVNLLRKDVDVWTHSGATVLDIYNDIHFNIDLSKYHTVIVHVGGNDADRRKDVRQFTSIYDDLIAHLQRNQCLVYVSEILPRATCDVTNFNNRLYELCHDRNVSFIANVEIFLNSENNISKHLYWSDGVHLNNNGIIHFLKNIDGNVKLFNSIRSNQYRDRKMLYNGNYRNFQGNGN